VHIDTADRSIPITVLAPSGRLDALSAPELRRRCDELLEADTDRIVVDLRAVDFCDSAGLAALVSSMKRSRAAGGDTKLVASADASVWRILELTRFDRVFDVRADVDAAVRAFSS
jgi:anti-sigma B factor antagonist